MFLPGIDLNLPRLAILVNEYIWLINKGLSSKDVHSSTRNLEDFLVAISPSPAYVHLGEGTGKYEK